MAYPFTLIDTATGTYLDSTDCVLIPDEAATPLWLGDETNLSPPEVSEMGKGGWYFSSGNF